MLKRPAAAYLILSCRRYVNLKVAPDGSYLKVLAGLLVSASMGRKEEGPWISPDGAGLLGPTRPRQGGPASGKGHVVAGDHMPGGGDRVAAAPAV